MSAHDIDEDMADAPPRSGRGIRRVTTLVALVALLVALLPTVVAKTPLRDWAVRQATTDLNGRVTVSQARFGWFGGQSLGDVAVYGADDQQVARIKTVSLDDGLLKLILNRSQLGTVRIERPELHVVVGKDFTNIERLLQDMVDVDEEAEVREAEGPQFALQLEIVDGRIDLEDTINRESWTIDQVNATCTVGGAAAGDVNLKLTALVPSAEPGTLRLALAQGPQADAAKSGGIEMRVVTERLPLGIVGAALSRVTPGIHLTGSGAADVT
ncbi:MAG: hypothetical protein R3C10_03540 [Pirellulales bacterium]